MPHPGTYDSILEIIGSAPVAELRRLRGDRRGAAFAKLELLNPGGSVVLVEPQGTVLGGGDPPGSRVATLIPDGFERYLSTCE